MLNKKNISPVWFIIGAIFIGLAGIFYVQNTSYISAGFSNKTLNQPNNRQSEKNQIYRSRVLKYQIEFPKQYYIRDYDNFFKTSGWKGDTGFAYITDIDDKSNLSKASFSINLTPTYFNESLQITNSKENKQIDTSKLSFQEYTEKKVLADCYGVGAEGDQYCDKVMSVIPYSTLDGISGYKVYVHGIRRGNNAGEFIQGPVYLFDISIKRIFNSVRGLEVSYHDLNSTGAADNNNAENISEPIVKSLKFY